MKVKFERGLSDEIKKYVAHIIRRINMELNASGFAANKGWTDRFLTNEFGFSWYLNSSEARDKAHNILFSIINKGIASKIKIVHLSPREVKKTFYLRVLRQA